MTDITTLTMDPSLDKSTSIDHVVPDRKLRCNTPDYDPGGGGVNVSRAIKRLGGESIAHYAQGGASGERLEKMLKKEEVEQRPHPISGETRVNLTIFETATENQFRFVMPGPELSHDEWQQFLNPEKLNLDETRYLVASGSLPPGVPSDFFRRLAKVAHDREIRLIVDTSGTALCEAAKEGVFLLKPNIRELGQLAGEEVRDEEHQEEISRKMVHAGKAQAIVVSLGAAGALLVTADLTERIHSPSVWVQSKIGAGDSMVAGIVLALSRGESLRKAVYYGVAAGAAAVMTPRTELCRLEDTESLYEQMTEKEKKHE